MNEETQQHALIGQRVADRFEVEALLGEGGMGAVYRARQLSVDRAVALKVLRPEYSLNEVAAERFLREARSSSALINNHTVTIFDFGRTDDGLLFLAMEYLEGCSLYEALASGGAIALPEAVRIIDEVAMSLSEAHGQGLIHRDIKPANIFLAQRSEHSAFVKVLDFGIALDASSGDSSLTETGTLTGTPAYISPEAIVSGRVDPRADVYALGLVFHEMLTGQPVFDGPTPFSVMQKRLVETPPPLGHELGVHGMPPALAELISRCLDRTPENRPADAQAFRAELGAIELGGAAAEPVATQAGLNRGQASSASDSAVRTTGMPLMGQAVTASGLEAPRSNRSWFMASLVVVLSVGVGILAFGPSEKLSEAPSVESAIVQPDTPEPEAEASPDAGVVAVVDATLPDAVAVDAVAPMEVKMTIISEPAGAAVWRNETELGQTPIVVSAPSDADLVLRFERRGHRSQTRSFVVESDKIYTVKLVRLAKRVKSKRSAPVRFKPADKPAAGSDKKKLIDTLLGD